MVANPGRQFRNGWNASSACGVLIMSTEPTRQTVVRQWPGSAIASQIRALTRSRASVRLYRERAWASITFSGMRYGFSIEYPDIADAEALRKLARALPEHEFALPGYFVADAVITDQSDLRLTVEILIIADPVQPS